MHPELPTRQTQPCSKQDRRFTDPTQSLAKADGGLRAGSRDHAKPSEYSLNLPRNSQPILIEISFKEIRISRKRVKASDSDEHARAT